MCQILRLVNEKQFDRKAPYSSPLVILLRRLHISILKKANTRAAAGGSRFVPVYIDVKANWDGYGLKVFP
jgi:hypothetical protein